MFGHALSLELCLSLFLSQEIKLSSPVKSFQALLKTTCILTFTPRLRFLAKIGARSRPVDNTAARYTRPDPRDRVGPFTFSYGINNKG